MTSKREWQKWRVFGFIKGFNYRNAGGIGDIVKLGKRTANTHFNIPVLKQEGSVADLHSFWSTGSGSAWEYGSRSGSRRAKMTHKSEENSSFKS